MKKEVASKSAFFTPRVVVGLAAIGVFFAPLAFSLYSGGYASAQVVGQNQSGMPDFVESAPVYHGTVVRITDTPFEGIGVSDPSAPLGHPRLASRSSRSGATDYSPRSHNASPTSADQASQTPTPTPTPIPAPCGASTPMNQGFESGTLSGFTTNPPFGDYGPYGIQGWSAVSNAAHTGTFSAFAPDVTANPGNGSDQFLTANTAITIPASASSATLSFWHRFDFDYSTCQGCVPLYEDGGVLEVSVDGATYQDAFANITSGGYNGTLDTDNTIFYPNPLGGRAAWVGNPNGTNFTQVTVNLLPYAGHNLLFRFRVGCTGSNYSGAAGWWVDDVRVDINNVCPTPTPTPNSSPTINAASPITRQQGTAASSSTIATVSDAETAAGSLVVTATTVPTGLTISNIVNTNGTITANIAASCTATTGSKTIVLQVSDGSLTNSANLTVNVTANSAPVLTYNNISVGYTSNTLVNPATASDNGVITSFALQSQGTFTGTISVNSSTGDVGLNTAAPPGTHTITIRATDNCGAIKDASFLVTVADTAPSITPSSGLSRVQGGPTVTSTVATVSDAESDFGSLTVTAPTVPPGLTISNVVNTAGSIKADITASCGIATGNQTIVLQVSDGVMTTNANLVINVTANTAPVLTYSNSSVSQAGSGTVNPATASDNGTVSYALHSQGTYTGTISVNSSTGVVSLSNAAPVGTSTITVRATDNCGATTDASFSLQVINTNTAPTITPVSNARVQGSPAVNHMIATVSDAESSAGTLTVTATTVPTGLTISNIVNTNGTVTADIAASCSISTGNKTIVLQVSDGNLTTNGNLTLQVLANNLPVLTYNNPASIAAGGSTSVSPATSSDNGTQTFSVFSQGTYTGTISVNASGVVSISNAAPVGSHTITIRATDNCGATKDASFTLPVYDPSAIDSLDANITGGGYVRATALQTDGKLIIVGSFDHVLGAVRNNIARLNANGTLDTGFDPNAVTGEVDCVVVQRDGKVVLAGGFTDLRPNGVITSRNGIARLNSDGSMDTGFDPNPSGFASVSCMALQPDEKILVGGSFTSIGGQNRSRIARLNTGGTADSFNPNVTSASTGVFSIAVQADGKVLLGGSFTTLQPNGVGTTFTRNRIARVDSTGAVDSFDPSVTTASSNVNSVAVQADGKVLLGGSFTTVGGQTRNRIARVDSTGAVDNFNPNIGSAANLQVYCLAQQTDGKVLLGGAFTSLQPNGAPSPTTRNRIARVNSDGTLDTGFDPNANNPVMTIALQPDGKVLLGGQFTTLQPNGTPVAIPRNFFGRLFNDPATQSVTAPDTSKALWSRGGAGPEVSQVTFETSANPNGPWTALGSGTRVGTTSNWQLTGLSLPTSGYLRTRGLATSGFLNGSSSVIEQVASYITSPPNAAPTITPTAGLSRQQGTTAANATIANVNDAESSPGSLIVTATTVPAGLTVSNIVNTNGTITADVAAGCLATTGNNTVVLQVSDGSLTNNANLTINVTANSAPVLVYQNNATTYGGTMTPFSPSTVSDSGSIASFALQSQGTYTGTISVNASNGVVSISNAAPAGLHTITIRATDNCGSVADATFILAVNRKGVTVTADGKVKVKGASDPTFTYVATGLVGSDTLSGTLTRSPGETPGTYMIIQGTVTNANNPNYTITFTSANLIITGPVAGADGVTRTSGSLNTNIPLATLLTNDYRVDSSGASQTNNLSVTGVTAGAGNSVSISGANVVYTPNNASASAPLTFTYTLTDSVTGATDVGTVTVTTVASGPFALNIVHAGMATYNSGTNTTSITIDFKSLPSTALSLEYSLDLNGWAAYSGNPVNSDATGSFNVTFTASGNQTIPWNKGMFFRASTP